MKNSEDMEELMSSSLLEIVELPSGDVVLRRVDDGEAPLVKIQFSKEAKEFLGDARSDVARAMIGTGVQLVGRIYEQDSLEERDSYTLH